MAKNYSRIVMSLEKTQKGIFWSKCCGISCMLCCCLGCICYLSAKAIDIMLEDVNAIIGFYTKKILNNLAILINIQQKLFIQACCNVNEITNSLDIISDLRLIDVICENDQKIASILQINYHSVKSLNLARNIIFPDNKNYNKEYLLKVYNEYIKLGGDISPIIYGFPEYMTLYYDPTSEYMLNLYKKILSQNQLNHLILSYKGACESEFDKI